MILRSATATWLTVLCLVGSACNTAGSRKAERLQTLADRLQVEKSLPGISIAIAQGSSVPITATAGSASIEDRTAVAPETAFFVGSISKNIFATVALQLVDNGRLDLDDPLSTFVEWPSGDEITLKMLMNHTAGIPEYLTDDRFELLDDTIPEFFARPRPPSEILEMLQDRGPTFDPGSRQQYSNTNALLLGEVIRHATGRSLGEVYESVIAKPLELHNTYLYGVDTIDRPRARGYSSASHWGAKDGKLVECSFADDALPDSADGSVVASAADLLRYHQALREGRILSDESWTAMSTVERGLHNGFNYLLGEGQFGPYAGNVGRAMGHVAASIYYPDHDLYLVVLANRGDGQLPITELVEAWLSIDEAPR